MNRTWRLFREMLPSVIILAILFSDSYMPKEAQAQLISQHYNVQQERVIRDGVMVSRPTSLDQTITDIMYAHQIRTIEDYSIWLEENITYEKDGLKDKWAKPLETLRKKRADCEDYAFLTSDVARILGYQPRFVALVKANKKGKVSRSHAICAFKRNGVYVWFDNAKLIETTAKTFEEFAAQVTHQYHYTQMSELDVDTNDWSTVYKRS